VTNKDWNFPKKHSNSHLFDDIQAKGVTRNYNAKPNEKMHGPLKAIYLQRTNFRDVATQVCCIVTVFVILMTNESQILRYDHWLLTLNSMRNELDELDLHNQATTQPDSEAVDDIGNIDAHVKLGSKQENCSFADVEELHKADSAFVNFRIKLNNFLNNFLPAHGIPLPDPGRRIQLKASDQVH